MACDFCDVWLHKSCASLNSADFGDISNHSWQCYCCRSINTSSFVFQTYNLNVSNSFDPLAGIPGDDSVFFNNVASPTNKFDPRVTSSPNNIPTLNKNISLASSKLNRDSSNATQLLPPAQRNNLRIGSFNANSIKGKRAELAELADSTLMDVMIITETKLPSQKEVKELSKNPSSKENVYLSLKPSEVLPKNFDGSIHKPRSIHGGKK